MKLLRLGAIGASSGAAPEPAEWIAGGDTITLGGAVGIDTSGASSVTIDGQTFDAVLVTLPDGTAANELTQIVTAGGGEAVLSGHIEGDAAGQARVSLPDVIVFALWDHAAGTHRIRTASGGAAGIDPSSFGFWQAGNTRSAVYQYIADSGDTHVVPFIGKTGGSVDLTVDPADENSNPTAHWSHGYSGVTTHYIEQLRVLGYYTAGAGVEMPDGSEYVALVDAPDAAPSGATDTNWQLDAGASGNEADVRRWVAGNSHRNVIDVVTSGADDYEITFNGRTGSSDFSVAPSSVNGSVQWVMADSHLVMRYLQGLADLGYYDDSTVLLHGDNLYRGVSAGDQSIAPSGDTDANWQKLSGGAGTDGTDGADGRTIHTVSAAPAAGLGADGDYAIDSTTAGGPWLYGPKAAGAWPAAVTLKGADGGGGAALLFRASIAAGGGGSMKSKTSNFNAASISKSDSGLWVLTLTNPLPDTDVVVTAQVAFNDAGNFLAGRSVAARVLTTTTIEITTTLASGNGSDVDFDVFAFGS